MDKRAIEIIEIAEAAADYASDNFRLELQVEKKSSKIDLVTRVDKETQRKIVSAIESHYPEDSIVGEEGDQKKIVPESDTHESSIQ